MKKIIGHLSLVLMLILVSHRFHFAQSPQSMGAVETDAVLFPALLPEKSHLELFVWVRNNQLQFVKEDSLFRARFQINLDIALENGTSLLTRDTTRMITQNRYPDTIDPMIRHMLHYRLFLEPNKYIFRTRLLDLNSRLSYIDETRREVRAIGTKQLSVSDILILSTSKPPADLFQVMLHPRSVPIRDSLYLFTEVIVPTGTQDFEFEAFVVGRGAAKGFRISNRLSVQNRKKLLLIELQRENMMPGINDVQIKVRSGRDQQTATKQIYFRRENELATSGSLDELIEQLTYVAEGQEWNTIKNSQGTERETAFDNFWKRRDPTPDSPQNELFNEYYKRVGTANQLFSTSRESGWRTDRGRVYVIYGPPDNIERGSSESTRFESYEIWTFNELQKKFVFYDANGFGDFRLVSGNID